MDIQAWLIRLALGAGIGFCIGLTGIGGGVLVLPSLTLVLGLPASVAVGTASLYACLTKSYATYEHFKLKTIDVQISLLLLLGAVPGDIATAWAINRVVGRMDQEGATLAKFQHGLGIFIACIVLLSAVLLVIDLIARARGVAQKTKVGIGGGLGTRPVLKRVVAVCVGAVIGALIGATSVGGGVLLIPALIIIFGLPSSRTVGTSIFVAVILTLATSLVYSSGGQMDWRTALLMATGSLAGVPLGSKLCTRLPEKGLRILVIGVVFVSAVLMFVKRGTTGGH